MEGQHSVVRAIGLHHIAITIKRPDFNRYGAWFDAGNVQLHLIKGEPCVPNGGSLIIPHFALEVQDPDALYSSLKRNNIRMDINKLEYNKGAPTNNDPDTLVQYFIRDPDGYYLELCNCSILNGFCLDNYREGLPDQHYSLPSLSVLTRFVRRVVKARNFTPPSHEDILRSAKRAEREDEEKAQKLLQRRRVYGDICQGFTEGELRETLRQAGNHVPTAILLLKHNTKSNVKIPPKFQAYDPEAGRVTTTHPPAVDFTNMKKQDAEATN